jgi:hypothetical protein
MKTALSTPDDVWYAAEELSQRLGVSRSELSTKAVAAFDEGLLSLILQNGPRSADLYSHTPAGATASLLRGGSRVTEPKKT